MPTTPHDTFTAVEDALVDMAGADDVALMFVAGNGSTETQG